ncbi:TPA: TIGR03757 family integrating conjugative element protein [Pasteurella multocida]|nr:TIGR03757 family integrating conjugative element protein [Pasteurella multocida]
MRRILLSTVLLFLSYYGYTKENSSVMVTVYTTQNYPIKNTNLADYIYQLDAVEIIEEQISQSLGQDPLIAEKQAKRLMQDKSWMNFQNQLIQAYHGVTKGWKNGIMKVPAIVFNEDSPNPSVIYGEQDVAKAISLYKSHQ